MFPIKQYLKGLLLSYATLFVTRFIYIAENWGTLGDVFSSNSITELTKGFLLFDTSALMYLSIPYTLMMLLPLHFKENATFRFSAKCVWMIGIAIVVVSNLADSVFFPYTGRRTTASVFSEFSNEGNILGIVGTELFNHWYLVLIAAVLFWTCWKLYDTRDNCPRLRGKIYYPVMTCAFALMSGLTVAGMRGGFTTAVRPITISNANQYVRRPIEAAAVLNTPFSIIRTIGKKSFVDPGYFKTVSELDTTYSPVHTSSFANDSVATTKRNVVILICESLGREYLGQYTPFIDSLSTRSLTFSQSFANGRKSIDGMPSILSGIPMFIEPFFLTPASLNQVGGIARFAGEMGYESAFFHGAENGSMGFQAFANITGFQRYYGRTEYGDGDFDGTWAVWDEPFLQFMASHITTDLKEPFVSAVFTASSHHPFHIPEQYKEQFPEKGGHPLHKCIRYLDYSLQKFFETASRQPWYANTLFVITADHTNAATRPEYKTDLGLYRVPVIFFDPSGEVFPAEQRNAIAQQTDILPTLLSAIGYNKPYVAWGADMMSTPDSLTWAVNYNNGIYQYVQDSLFLQSDGNCIKAVYNYMTDPLLQQDVTNCIPKEKLQTTHRRLQAIIQSYMIRMNQDSLVIR